MRPELPVLIKARAKIADPANWGKGNRITNTVTFWVFLTAAFALLVAFESAIWLPHALLSAANVGAKCVRAELAERRPAPQPAQGGEPS